MRSGPHQMNIGWRVFSSSRTAVRSVCGQASGGPREVAAQSKARVSAPISPPLARKPCPSGAASASTGRGVGWAGRKGVLLAAGLLVVGRLGLLQKAEAGAHHLAHAAIPAGCNPSVDEGFEPGRESLFECASAPDPI